MVEKLINVTSLTGNGLRDWLIQRVSAVILAVYTLFLVGYLLFYPGIDYFAWQDLFSCTWVKVFSILALLSLYAHSWVGIWTVLTDYVKPAWLRLLIQVLVILTLISYLIWGIQILWGI